MSVKTVTAFFESQNLMMPRPDALIRPSDENSGGLSNFDLAMYRRISDDSRLNLSSYNLLRERRGSSPDLTIRPKSAASGLFKYSDFVDDYYFDLVKRLLSLYDGNSDQVETFLKSLRFHRKVSGV